MGGATADCMLVAATCDTPPGQACTCPTSTLCPPTWLLFALWERLQLTCLLLPGQLGASSSVNASCRQAACQPTGGLDGCVRLKGRRPLPFENLSQDADAPSHAAVTDL